MVARKSLTECYDLNAIPQQNDFSTVVLFCFFSVLLVTVLLSSVGAMAHRLFPSNHGARFGSNKTRR